MAASREGAAAAAQDPFKPGLGGLTFGMLGFSGVVMYVFENSSNAFDFGDMDDQPALRLFFGIIRRARAPAPAPAAAAA